MVDLEKMVIDAFDKIKAEGFIETKIQEAVKKTIASILEDVLGHWSPFMKTLKEKISQELNINLAQISLVEYNQIITNIIKAQLDGVLVEDAKKRFEEEMKKTLAPIKNKWKLSEIIKECVDFWFEDNEEEYQGNEISFYCSKESSDLWFVYFDKESDKSEYQCAYRITISNGRIRSIRIDDRDASKMFMVGDIFNEDRFLFQLYSQKVEVEVDADYVETSFPGFDD